MQHKIEYIQYRIHYAILSYWAYRIRHTKRQQLPVHQLNIINFSFRVFFHFNPYTQTHTHTWLFKFIHQIHIVNLNSYITNMGRFVQYIEYRFETMVVGDDKRPKPQSKENQYENSQTNQIESIKNRWLCYTVQITIFTWRVHLLAVQVFLALHKFYVSHHFHI